MIALGIEGTAHTCGVGIVDDSGKILANEIDMYKPATGRDAVGTGTGPDDRSLDTEERSRQKKLVPRVVMNHRCH